MIASLTCTHDLSNCPAIVYRNKYYLQLLKSEIVYVYILFSNLTL